MSKEYYPLVTPKDVAVKNTGKLIVLKIQGKEYELRKDTIDQMVEMVNFVLHSKHPTGWITGYTAEVDMEREDQATLWPVDNDPIVGAI